MPRKQSAHAELDQLRQAAATERVKQRELEVQKDAAKVKVESAGASITEAYAAEDRRLVAKCRKDLDAAKAEVLDLEHRVAAAGLRIDRAQAEAENFQAEHARELLDEKEPEARTLAENLTRAVHEAVQLHRGYREMRTDIDSLVAAVPGATSRADGPDPSHAWEDHLRALERAIQENPEVPPPLPEGAGLKHRQEQDKANRLEREKRSGETPAPAHATRCARRPAKRPAARNPHRRKRPSAPSCTDEARGYDRLTRRRLPGRNRSGHRQQCIRLRTRCGHWHQRRSPRRLALPRQRRSQPAERSE
jgi:hypothetical protein